MLPAGFVRGSRERVSNRDGALRFNGIVGVCLLIGALRTRVASFNAEGTATALATVVTLATLTLVLPTFTTSSPGPEFSSAQLAFAATASIALYALFVVVQTVRHRDYFLPESGPAAEMHAAPPSTRATIIGNRYPDGCQPLA